MGDGGAMYTVWALATSGRAVTRKAARVAVRMSSCPLGGSSTPSGAGSMPAETLAPRVISCLGSERTATSPVNGRHKRSRRFLTLQVKYRITSFLTPRVRYVADAPL